MRAHPQAFLTAAALLAAACGEKKAPAPVVTLGPTADTLPTTLSDATAGAWLGGRRWAVLDAPGERVEIADVGARTVTPLGAGAAKAAAQSLDPLPRRRHALRGRLGPAPDLALDARRAVRRARCRHPMRRAARCPGRATPAGGTTSSSRPGRAPTARATAIPPRWSAPARGSTARTRSPGSRRSTSPRIDGEAGRRFERRVFSGADQWGALPDGSLWVGRVYDNRVDWRDPSGQWTRGEPLPDRVLEVTRYDRELFLRRFPPELRGTAEQLPFAPVKPPFEAGLTGPTGEIWLEKSRAPADSSRRYHVVDRRGQSGRRDPGPRARAYHRRGAGRRARGRAVAGRHPAAPVLAAGTLRAGRALMSPVRRFPRRSDRMKLSPPFCALALLAVACRPAASQGAPDARQEAAGDVRPAEQRGRAAAMAGWPSPTPRRSCSCVADLKSGQGGHARHPGGFADHATRLPDQYKFPGWVAHLAGRHRRAGGLQRGSAPRSGTRPASRSACCRSSDVAGKTPVLVYDTLGNGYKVDYQAVLGGAEPGQPVRPDSVPVLRIALKTRQGGHGGQPRVARVRRRDVRRADAAGGQGVRPERFLRRAAERHRVARAGARRTGWTGAPPTASGRREGAASTPRRPSPRPTATGCWPRCASTASSSACRRT